MATKKKSAIDYWAGTEQSLEEYQIRAAQGEALQVDSRAYRDEDDERTPYLLEVVGATGVIHINGPLTNKDAWYNEFLKIPSYNAIKDALVAAATDTRLEQIVLNINSGGGPVSGISDTADLIQKIDAQIKPIYTYTESSLASAAYWLGCSASKVFSSELAVVGSIGVIATHAENSKELAEAGITVTTLRAGKYKALASSTEPLTETAREEIQARIDTIYGIFAEHVAKYRGRTYSQVDSQMGQGREFLGSAALAVGLVDGVTTLDKLMSKLEETSLDTPSTFRQTAQQQSNGAKPMKTRLTAQQVAAIAAGAAVTTDASTDTAVTTAAETVDTTVVATTEGTEVADPAATGAEATTAEATAEVTNLNNETTAISLLTGQLAEANTQLVQARVDLQTAQNQIAEAATATQALLGIAVGATNNMRIALGMSALDMAGLNAKEVVAAHTSLSAEFVKSFKAGGVAAVAASKEVSDKPAPNPMQRVLVQAAGAKFSEK